jgi:hypothetical protein
MKFNSNPLEPAVLEISSPEFLTTNDVRKYFGIRKGTLYNLAKLGKVRGKALRVTGQFKGVLTVFAVLSSPNRLMCQIGLND